MEHAGHKLLKLDDPALEFRFEVKNLNAKVQEMTTILNVKKTDLIGKHSSIIQSTNMEMDQID